MKSQTSLQIGSKGKKFIINRELKVNIPRGLLKSFRRALETHGVGQALSMETGLSYNTLAAAAKTGVATQTTINAIQNTFNPLVAL